MLKSGATAGLAEKFLRKGVFEIRKVRNRINEIERVDFRDVLPFDDPVEIDLKALFVAPKRIEISPIAAITDADFIESLAGKFEGGFAVGEIDANDAG